MIAIGKILILKRRKLCALTKLFCSPLSSTLSIFHLPCSKSSIDVLSYSCQPVAVVVNDVFVFPVPLPLSLLVKDALFKHDQYLKQNTCLRGRVLSLKITYLTKFKNIK